jgi:hypothetical protein
MSDLQDIVAVLVDALLHPKERKRLIHDFQKLIWSKPQPVMEERILEVLRDLAYDLDFYEPDPKKRAEDGSYYGDDRAVEEVESALDKLKKEDISIPAIRVLSSRNRRRNPGGDI